MKIELTPENVAFIKGLEATTVEAASKNSQEYFDQPVPNAVFNSRLSPQNGDRPDVLKVKISDGSAGPETTVVVSKRQGGGRLTKPVPGTVADITPGCYVLPLIRVQGGVYFINGTYGTSLVVAHVLIVKDEGGHSGVQHQLDYGDVEFIDGAACEE